jgi:hypothetical protein
MAPGDSVGMLQIDKGYVQGGVQMSPDPWSAAQIQNAQIGFDIHPGCEDAHASCPALFRKGP